MSDRPNILFLMTDQHRWDALGCVSSLVQTPNLDSLATSGIHFTQAVCNAPICVPSRYSMMTGLYPSQLGVRFNQQTCPNETDLPVPLLAQHLAQAGYRTGGFGKTHWYEWALRKQSDPQRRGFEERALCAEGEPHMSEAGACLMEEEYGGVPPAMAEIHELSRKYIGESEMGYLGGPSSYPIEEHREGWAANKAIEFLDRNIGNDNPFFCYLSLDFPHAPSLVPPGYEEHYRISDIPDRVLAENFETLIDHHDYRDGEIRKPWMKRTPEERRMTTLRYFALVTAVDDLVGRVMAKLKASDAWENTLVVFTSDHGEMLGDRNHRFSKFCLYEGSVRVPLILSGGRVPADSRGLCDKRPTELVDLVPTLLTAAGIPPSAELPGLDLLSNRNRLGAFAEFHGSGYEKNQLGPVYMWRTNRWKLILQIPGFVADAVDRIDQTQGELFDLSVDPVELNNLYEKPALAGVSEQMTRDLLMHLAACWARYPRKPTAVAL